MRRKLGAILFAVHSLLFLSAFGSQHSKLETESQLEGQNLKLKFLVKPNPGMLVTKEGPWSLTLSNISGLKLEQVEGKFVTKEFDEKLPGFAISPTIEAQTTEAKADYVIRAFVCTEDKKHCYPQQHKGTFSWKKSG